MEISTPNFSDHNTKKPYVFIASILDENRVGKLEKFSVKSLSDIFLGFSKYYMHQAFMDRRSIRGINKWMDEKVYNVF